MKQIIGREIERKEVKENPYLMIDEILRFLEAYCPLTLECKDGLLVEEIVEDAKKY